MGQQSAMRIRLRRRIGMAAIVGATCFGGVVTSFAPASAAPSTGSASASPAQPNLLAPVAAEVLAQLQVAVASGDSNVMAIYEDSRDNLAISIANRLLIEPGRMIAAWDRADVAHQTALMAALSQMGTPYRRNTSKPGVGFDCSGLTTYAWSVAGLQLTRQSGSQIRAAAPRTQETAMAGDLVYYPGHVMIYLGVDHAIVHAIQPGRPVDVDYASKRHSLKFGDPTA
jgi:cell wall-associated NlpC family hydrolase